MFKKQILGVVVLLGAVTIPLNYNIFINYEQVAAESTSVREEFESAKKKAEDARDLAKASGESEMYPGLADYMDRLINEAGKYGDYTNTETVTAALNEAAEAIPYLLGTNRQKVSETRIVTPVTYSTTSAELTKNEGEAIDKEAEPEQVAQVGIKLEVKNETVEAAKSASKANATVTEGGVKVVNVESRTEATVAKAETNQVAEGKAMESENTPVEAVELPKTGGDENSKMSYAGLVIAGVAVVVSTVAASIAMIAAKRKR